MIRYNLTCERGHEFEGWFRSSCDFDDQSARGLLSCGCGSQKVEKALMAPSVSGTDNSAKSEPEILPPQPMVKPDPRDVAMRQMMKAFREHVMQRTEDVGERFPEEARRIHYEEDGTRAIRGRATPDEARALLEEGIGVAPLPAFPDDQN
jgi:hypothetical protein